MFVANKILFCATVDYHFRVFHIPYLKWFKSRGWEVHMAAAGNESIPFVDQRFNIPIDRSPFRRQNLNAYKELKKIIEQNHYDIIHCHTPMGGVLSRLAAINKRINDTKMLYTAHGFHFCKGSSWKNWLLYYPIEKWLSRYTDCLITINEEDYHLAVNRHFKAKQIAHVHGMGVNTDTFFPVTEFTKSVLRANYQFDHDHFIMFYAAEFNRNKNQKILIAAFAALQEKIPKAKLLLAGEGPLMNECKRMAKKHGIRSSVFFLGYRKDIDTLLKMSDIAVASSLREGLPVNILEAMACGLPIVAVDNRGHRELIVNGQNGWLVKNDPEAMADKMVFLSRDKILRKEMGKASRKIVMSKYSLEKTLEEQIEIYKRFMGGIEEVQWAVQ
ncbi:glycosyltransferase family 4 protein [Siminovitchia sediminis]|uniref:Glycosyltransferase family 4 protein n=1 Tax=Siminovitchia sediminis TaxID=1274353 RepID=A0ABW4KL92_9BACI